MSYLYILNINHLLVTSFTNIFSCSVDDLVLLSIASFAVQNLLHLITSYLFIFIFNTLEGGSKKDLTVIYVKECFAYVFLEEFYSVWLYI